MEFAHLEEIEAYIDKELSSEEVQAFETRLEENKELAAYAKGMLHAFNVYDHLRYARGKYDDWKKAPKGIKKKRPSGTTRKRRTIIINPVQNFPVA